MTKTYSVLTYTRCRPTLLISSSGLCLRELSECAMEILLSEIGTYRYQIRWREADGINELNKFHKQWLCHNTSVPEHNAPLFLNNFQMDFAEWNMWYFVSNFPCVCTEARINNKLILGQVVVKSWTDYKQLSEPMARKFCDVMRPPLGHHYFIGISTQDIPLLNDRMSQPLDMHLRGSTPVLRYTCE